MQRGEHLQRKTESPAEPAKILSYEPNTKLLGFAFYYKLVEPLVSFEYVQQDVYIRGLWEYRLTTFPTTFPSMCAHFASTFQESRSISRTQVLYMLASMYDGRPKPTPTPPQTLAA